MTTLPHSASDLKLLYAKRFAGRVEYRRAVWGELCSFLSKWIPEDATVLDLGCGYCEFINAVTCRKKIGIDLNPDAEQYASPEVTLIQQDTSSEWHIPPSSVDVVFTSNFFEHLPSKQALELTLEQAGRALRRGGRLIAMGPNIKYAPGKYWDYFDHYLALTERSLAEVLVKHGFAIDFCEGRFLPFTMSDESEYPMWMLRAYLAFPIAWHAFGKQFLLVASKP